jgi:hypothetical protein
MNHGALFALTIDDRFVGVAAITQSPYDARGYRRPVGPGHAQAYAVTEACPWNDHTTEAFGSHYKTHSRIQISKDGQRGVVVVASVALESVSSPVPDAYFGAVTKSFSPKVQTFLEAWLEEGLHGNNEMSPKGTYTLHGLLFFKVPPGGAFSYEANLSAEWIAVYKKQFEAM